MIKGNGFLFFLISLYLLLVPVMPSTFKYMGIPVNSNILLILILLFYFFRIIVDKDSRKKFTVDFSDFITDYSGLFLLLMIFSMFLSIPGAFDRKVAVKECLRFTSYIMLFFVVKYELDDYYILRRLLNIIMSMSTVVAGIGILEYLMYLFEFKKIPEGFQGVISTLDNPNLLAAFLMLSLFPLVVLALKEYNGKKRILYIIGSIVVFACILLTDSRNALLGLVVGTGLLSLIYSKRIIIFALILGGVSLFIPGVLGKVMQITNMTLNVSRLKLWKTALYMIKDHPIFGIGNGNFPYLYESYVKIHKELKHYYYVVPRHPHNLLLEIQTEIGILGTIAFILLLLVLILKFKAFRAHVRNEYIRNFYSGFSISLFVFFFMNLFDSFFSAPKIEVYFWVLLGIHGAIIYNRKHLDMER